MSGAQKPTGLTQNVRRASFLVFMVGLVAYHGAMDNEFVGFDDFALVTRHEDISKGLTWAGIRSAFAVPVLGNWTPLAWVSSMIDVELYGLWAGGHHLTAVLIHAATAAGLIAVLHQKRPLIESFACGLIFAIHPVHVESVAWVAERRDVLSMFFFTALLGVWLNDAWRTTGRGQIVVLLLLIAALWSKSTMVTVPAVLVLVDVFLLDRRREGLFFLLVREKWPLWVACAIVAVFTTVAQEPSHVASENLGFRLVGAVVAYAHYVQSFLAPHDLAVLYPRPKVWPPAEVLGAVTTVVGTLLAATATWRRSRSPLIPLGILWFGGTLVPMIGILQVGGQAYADRYLYLSSIGLFFLFWGILDGLKRWPANGASGGETLRSWPVVVGVGWCLSLTALTIRQVEVWTDNDTLWLHALETGNDSLLALQAAGNAEVRRGDFQRALTFYERADKHDMPPELALSMGYAEYRTGTRDRGRHSFATAIEHGQEGPAPHFFLARVNEDEGRFDDALMAYRVAIALGAKQAAWLGLGRTAIRLGRTELVREADDALALLARKSPAGSGFCFAALAWYDSRSDDTRSRLDAMLALHPNIVDAVVFRSLLTPPTDPMKADLIRQLRELEGESARWTVLARLHELDGGGPATWTDLTPVARYGDGAWRRLAAEMAAVAPTERPLKATTWKEDAVTLVVEGGLGDIEMSAIDHLSLRK